MTDKAKERLARLNVELMEEGKPFVDLNAVPGEGEKVAVRVTRADESWWKATGKYRGRMYWGRHQNSPADAFVLLIRELKWARNIADADVNIVEPMRREGVVTR